MQCTLYIPGLFGQAGPQLTALPDARLPGLSMLLRRARIHRLDATGTTAWLCSAWGLEKQRDFPVAALTLPLDGGVTGDACWMRFDPAHVDVGRSGLTLIEPSLLDITPDEAAALTATINEHLARDGLTVEARTPSRWYVKLPTPPALETVPLEDAAGRDIAAYQPHGHDALHWHGVLNELQMLLHQHPVNGAREAGGALTINSVWPWGCGTPVHVPGHPYSAVWTQDILAQALATHSGADTGAPPPDASTWLNARAKAGHGHDLVMLTDAGRLIRYGDESSWFDQLLAMDTRWIEPLTKAVASGRLAQFNIVAQGETALWRLETRRPDLYALWRRRRTFADFH